MSVLVILGQVILLLALTFIFLVNVLMFFVLIKNLGWLWKRKREDLLDQAELIANKVVDKLQGDSK